MAEADTEKSAVQANSLDGLTRETTDAHDVYVGSDSALIKAGIVQPHHLVAQTGRRKGYAAFMPDGQPLPPGVPALSLLPGFMAIQALSDDSYRVKLTVSPEERARRSHAKPARVYEYKFSKTYYGEAHQLLEIGVPSHWFEGLPLPGKSRGKRTLYEGETRIEVCVGPRGEFRIEVTHIDYYKDWGAERLAEMRREWRLSPTPQASSIVSPLRASRAGGLRLVWSAP